MERLEKVKAWLRTKYAKKVGYFILSVLGAVGACLLLDIGDYPGLFACSTFWILPLIFLLYLAYHHRKLPIKRGVKVIALVLAGLLAIALTLGRQLELLSAIRWTLSTLVTIPCLWAGLYIIVEYAVNFCCNFAWRGDFCLTRKQKWIIFAIILAVNLLVFLAVFPGIYSWDSSMQAYNFLYNQVNQHYSVLLGAVFGGLLGLSKVLFGNLVVGVAVATFLQLLFMSYIYTEIVCFATEYARSRWMAVGGVAFFTLTIIMAVSTTYITQDIVFAGIFALIFMELCRLAKDSTHWSSKWNVAKFIILAFLLCACRGNGFYILCGIFVVAIFVSTKRRRDLPILAVPIILSLIYTGPIFNLLGIPNVDSVREMMSVPSQQLARVYVLTPEALTEEEKAGIESYYRMDSFQRYINLPAKADPTKGALDGDKVTSNWPAYIALWGKIGLKNPGAYVEAFLLNSAGFWYPNKHYNDQRSDIPYHDYRMSGLWSQGAEFVDMRVDRQSLLPLFDKALDKFITSNAWQTIPVLSNIISMGTYFWLVMLLVALAIYRKQKELALPLSAIVWSYAILLLAPVAVFRYCYPIIILAPILCAMLFRSKPKRQRKGTK